MIHPGDAATLDLADGDLARVSNDIGSVEIPVEITEDMMPGVISIPHGFGHDKKGTRLSVASERPGISMNDLTDPELTDPLSGNAVLNGVPVEIEKVA